MLINVMIADSPLSCSFCTLAMPSYFSIHHFLSVCSLAGVSRSVTLVVAYIMTTTGLGWQEALAAVKVARPCAGPNLGFQRQLQEFETTQASQVSRYTGHKGCYGSAKMCA